MVDAHSHMLNKEEMGRAKKTFQGVNVKLIRFLQHSQKAKPSDFV